MVDERKVAFITCVNNEDEYDECLLYLKSLNIPEGMHVEYIAVREAKSMTSGYKYASEKSDAKYKIYLHQDTLIVNKDIVRDIIKLFSEDDIAVIGVIGCRSLPRSGVWWDAFRTYGKVLHACEAESVTLSACKEIEGAYIEAECVDGLIIITQGDAVWRDDLFDGWHFYDISVCFEARRQGKRVIIPRQDEYWCIHCPKEKPLDDKYKKYRRIFLHEYGKELNPEV